MAGKPPHALSIDRNQDDRTAGPTYFVCDETVLTPTRPQIIQAGPPLMIVGGAKGSKRTISEVVTPGNKQDSINKKNKDGDPKSSDESESGET